MLLNILEVCLRIMIMIINNNVDDKGNMLEVQLICAHPGSHLWQLLLFFNAITCVCVCWEEWYNDNDEFCRERQW